jgi:DNA-binding NarL/FixJ family response regulator
VLEGNEANSILNADAYHRPESIDNASAFDHTLQAENALLQVERTEASQELQKPALVYLDLHAFTRQCIGWWLRDSLREFSARILCDPEQIVTAPIISEHVRAVLINAGSARSSSSSIVSLTARVTELLPDVPIVMLSDYEDIENVRKAFDLGVRGYIPTSLASVVAIEAIRLVGAGGTFVPASVLGLHARAGACGTPLIEGFTQREVQILDCLRRGMANRMIACELKIGQETVKSHMKTIMKKLNAANRTHVAYLSKDLFDRVLYDQRA